MRDNEKVSAIMISTEGVAISMNLACKILHRGRLKVRSLLGTKIRIVADKGNSFGLNLADVLMLTGKNL